MSDTSRSQLFFAPEITWGVAPGGAYTALRFTGESLGQNSDTTESQEIRSDRQVADVVRNSIEASGDINFELSYEALDPFLEAVLGGTWTGDVLDNGTAEKSFSIEKKFDDIGEYVLFKGCQISTLSLKIVPGQIVTGTMSILGKNAVASGATDSSSIIPASTNPVTNAIDNINTIEEGGSAFTGSPLEINLTFNANLRSKPAIGVLGAADIGQGRILVSGSFKYYYEERALYSKFLNDTPSSLAFTVTDQLTNSLEFFLPRIKYISGNPVSPAIDQDVMPDLAFTAYLDPTTGVTARVTRTPV